MSADIEARSRSVIEQAARWYVRCTDEDMTVQECDEMRQWLEASAEHGLELASMFRMDALLVLHSTRLRQ